MVWRYNDDGDDDDDDGDDDEKEVGVEGWRGGGVK
jgi:hypothetical protein